MIVQLKHHKYDCFPYVNSFLHCTRKCTHTHTHTHTLLISQNLLNEDTCCSNMIHRMKKQYHMLNALNECSSAERKQLLRIARPELIHAICDCIVNVVYGKVPINNYKKVSVEEESGSIEKAIKF